MKSIYLATLSIFLLIGCSANHPIWTGGSGSSSRQSDSFTPRNAYERKVECNYQATKSFMSDRNLCYGTNVKDRFEQAKCLSSTYRMFSARSCSPTLNVSLNSVSFMWKQLADVYDPANSKNFSPSRREKIWKDTLELIKEEEEIGVTAAMREGREDKMAYNEARANRNFERSMSILGAQINNSSNQNTPSNRTYILNGKIINCSTFQNVTNCN
jgi:hypothetical protein